MKQVLKATAVILGIVAAVILNYFMKALGCFMIYVSETCTCHYKPGASHKDKDDEHS